MVTLPATCVAGLLLLTSQRTLGNQSEQFSFCNLLSFISFLTLLTSELHKQWNMKMKRPCNELQRAKRYWKTIVWLLRAKTPNIHVIPSKGNKTVIDFRPDLVKTRKEQKFDELNSCFLFIVYKFSWNGFAIHLSLPTLLPKINHDNFECCVGWRGVSGALLP